MFTLIHVVISVLGIISGLIAVGGLLSGVRLDRWIACFLFTTILTSATGFFFPFTRILPPHVVGAISLVVLAVCLVALYGKRLQGRWRSVFVLTAVTALYLNVFVLVAQLFAKTPALAQVAPTQTEPPFAVTQVVILAIFVGLSRAAVRGFRGSDARR